MMKFDPYKLNPLVSGYRDPKSQKLSLTTYYGLIYQKILENPDKFDVTVSGFSVTIRYDHIISISHFDPKAYSKFQEIDPSQAELF